MIGLETLHLDFSGCEPVGNDARQLGNDARPARFWSVPVGKQFGSAVARTLLDLQNPSSSHGTQRRVLKECPKVQGFLVIWTFDHTESGPSGPQITDPNRAGFGRQQSSA